MKPKKNIIIIKKYANRRLYDTGRSSYVTLEDLCEMIKEGHEFTVKDAKKGTDITRSVLIQIIHDQETKEDGHSFSLSFMKKLISFYGDTLQQVIPEYLEGSIETLVKNQELVRNEVDKSINVIGHESQTEPIMNNLSRESGAQLRNYGVVDDQSQNE